MRRRQKKEAITYPHPLLEPVLKRTLGIPLFQEQLLRMAMIVASFSGAEADELRRAVGVRRSWERMKSLEGKLRDGMTANGIDIKTQDTIVKNISSFALYGFPESHAMSFALIAYASAFFKVKYLAAFTCAILNNQPMGFYSPAVLIEDARRHGLRVKPIDIQVSEWACRLEREPDYSLSLRLGLGYAKGLRHHAAEAIIREREARRFSSVEDVALRVPVLNRKELALLARVGAMNSIDGVEHRRDALWQVERAGKLEGPLLRQQSEWLQEESRMLPLREMTPEERLVVDYAGTSVTTGPHPMFFRRQELNKQRYLTASELRKRKDGEFVKTAGLAIVKQRPGTAKGFVFMSVSDETDIFNVIVSKEFFERNRNAITNAKFISVEGSLQNEDNTIHIRASRIMPLPTRGLEVTSHDFR
jgi:error-prone DNA polymerase